MYSSETQFRSRYVETDQMGVVYHGNYFAYFEVGRAEWVRTLGLSYAEIETSGIVMPIVEVNCKYVRPAVYDQLLTIKTTLNELTDSHKINFHQEVLDEKGELLAFGRILLYFMEAKTMKKAKMPELMRKKLEPYFS